MTQNRVDYEMKLSHIIVIESFKIEDIATYWGILGCMIRGKMKHIINSTI